MRLIDADKLRDALQNEIDKASPPYNDTVGAIRCGVRLARNILEDAPTIDAVPVVRCKDCKWFDRISDKSCFGYCHAAEHCFRSKNWDVNIYRTHKEDFYCADGERSEDDA